jgi:hypothetical protein
MTEISILKRVHLLASRSLFKIQLNSVQGLCQNKKVSNKLDLNSKKFKEKLSTKTCFSIVLTLTRSLIQSSQVKNFIKIAKDVPMTSSGKLFNPFR